MNVREIKLLEDWDGTGFILLHQTMGFNFSEKRYPNGLTLDGVTILSEKSMLDVITTLKKLINMLNKHSKKDNATILPAENPLAPVG